MLRGNAPGDPCRRAVSVYLPPEYDRAPERHFPVVVAQLLARATAGRACFLSDYQDAYAVAPEAIADRMGIRPLPHINAGQFVLTRADYDLGVLDRYFGYFPPPTSPGWSSCEQTAEAVLLSRAGAERLGHGYQISMQPITDETISHHFVNDGSRLHFSTRGVRTLRRRGPSPPSRQIGCPACWLGHDRSSVGRRHSTRTDREHARAGALFGAVARLLCQGGLRLEAPGESETQHKEETL